MAKLRPLGDKILVKRVEAETKTKSGIVLPDSAKEKPKRGKILSLGDGKRLDNGERAPFSVKKGDEVIFAASSPGDGFAQGAVAFYASLHAPLDASPVELRPVYAWSDGDAHMLSTMDAGLERYGFTRDDIAFYTPRRTPG